MKYRLNIVDDKGSVFTVIGGDDLRQVAEDWTNETFDPPSRRLVVQGFGDDTFRRPIVIALDREVVKGVILEEL